MLLSNRAMIGSNPLNLYAFTNSATTEWSLRNNRSNWNKTGRLRNYHCGDANVSGLTNKASQPAGNVHPVAYVLAQKAGRISSHKICYLSLGGGAELTVGSLLFTSSCVVSLDGAATGTLIIGSLIDGIIGNVPAEGSSAILLGAVADLTALGWLAGNGPITLNGTLQSYATGWLQGSTEDKNVLTTSNIARAVWDALLANSTEDDTFGVFIKKLLTVSKFIGLK